MVQPRRTIFRLMLTVAVAAVALAIFRNPDPFELLLVVGVVLLVSPWVLAPLRLRRTHWVSFDSPRFPIDPEGTASPSSFSSAYRNAAEGLSALGFVPVGCFVRPDSVPNGVVYLAVFSNPETRELAKFITASVGFGSKRVATALVFQSEFEAGIEVYTSNSRTLTLVPPLGGHERNISLPDVEGLGTLYRVHRLRSERLAGGLASLDPLAEGLAAHLEKLDRRIRDHYIQTGYYHLDEKDQVLRQTWKGACLGAWKLMWPVKGIRLALRRSRARRELRRADLSTGPQAKAPSVERG